MTKGMLLLYAGIGVLVLAIIATVIWGVVRRKRKVKIEAYLKSRY